MQPHNASFILTHRHHLTFWKQSQIFVGLSGEIRSGFARVIREEFTPGYSVNLDCSSCVGEMLTRLEEKVSEWERQQHAVNSEFNDHINTLP